MKRILLLGTFLLSFAAMPLSVLAQTYGVTDDDKNSQNTPKGWKAVELPKVTLKNPSGLQVQNITSYGASTTSEDNSAAIQKAINALPASGGVVIIPKGTWLTGAFTLKSKTILYFQKGATLKLLPMGTWKNGSTPLISCNKYDTDIVVEGEDKDDCVIDGQGTDWWAVRDIYGKNSSEWKNLERPGLIDFQLGSSRFLIKNITLKDSPTSNIRLGKNTRGMNCTVHDVIIREPASELTYKASNGYGKNPSHNTDGIPVWTRYVNIYNCDISNGDDNVVMDTGAQFVHVWNCKFGTGHGASMGSYTSDLHDILWENITFEGTSAGFRLKSNVGRSGNVYNITMRNCTMNNVPGPISMTAWYDSEPKLPATAQDSTSTTPYYHDILIQNVTATNVNGESLHLFGRPESYIADITLDNVNIRGTQGMVLAYVRGLKFINGCNLLPQRGATFKTKYKATYTGKYDGSDATGITSPVAYVDTDADDNWYSLGGQKMNSDNLPKGIYIHHGMKYVVK